MSGDFLSTMATSSRERAVAAQASLSAAELRARIRDLPTAPRLRLSVEGFDLIAEMKLRSPAVGQLRSAVDHGLEDRVRQYAEAGAAAVSVLTEPTRFDGSLAHLQQAAAILAPLGIPAMRKDFLVDPYQVLEARAAGAGGVLLIVRMLEPDALAALLDASLEQDFFVLLEAFDEQDIELALPLLESRDLLVNDASSRVLLGVNCRDLVTLQVVPERLEEMVGKLPDGIPKVAESGLASAEDAERLAAAGYELALVGSALMSGEHPRMLAGEMLRAARAVQHRRSLGTSL